MTMKVLVAWDGSECAKAAMDDLRYAGLPPNAEALVMAVAEVWVPPAAPAVGERLTSKLSDMLRARNADVRAIGIHALEDERAIAAAGARRLQAMFPGWVVRLETSNGMPAWELLKRADVWQADLLVVGSRGRGSLERVLLGSVSQKLLNEAPCSVRIGRPRPRGEAPPRVAVGVDRSPHATSVIQAMAARAWPPGTEIRLIAADDPFGDPGDTHPDWDLESMTTRPTDATRAWTEAIIGPARDALRTSAVAVSERIGWGDAAHVLLEEASQWNADAIVVGARGVGRWHRLLLGSVSAAVAMRAPCSVEVIRHIDRARLS
jgi:nucleotide-binding universal stress UspA family protein